MARYILYGMAHHAYFITGDGEEGISLAHVFIERELQLPISENPNVTTLRYGLFSVEDARKLRSLAELSPTVGTEKVLVVSVTRLFHEAQNALLKLFEEPPAGTTLILVLPSEGMLLPTLRSRLLPLPSSSCAFANAGTSGAISDVAQEFISAKAAEREKLVTKIVERAKSDKDEEKQAARLSAIQLVEGLTIYTYQKWVVEKDMKKRTEQQLLLYDLHAFLPILHERSAPLKLIFEHILLVV
jgi:hypothetical protein